MLAFVVPLASLLHEATGSWSRVIGVLVAFKIVVAILAIGVLKPMRERLVAEEGGTTGRCRWRNRHRARRKERDFRTFLCVSGESR